MLTADQFFLGGEVVGTWDPRPSRAPCILGSAGAIVKAEFHDTDTDIDILADSPDILARILAGVVEGGLYATGANATSRLLYCTSSSSLSSCKFIMNIRQNTKHTHTTENTHTCSEACNDR